MSTTNQKSINKVSDKDSNSVWTKPIPLATDDAKISAGKAGLGRNNSEISLKSIDQRRLQLWMTSIVIGILVVFTLSLFSNESFTSLPDWLPREIVQLCMLLLVGLFSFYVIEKELNLRKLSKYLIEQQFETDVLTRRLKSVETVLESTKAINQSESLDRALEKIINQARLLLDEKDICLYLVRSDGELTASVGNIDQKLISLATKVMELNQSQFGKDPKQPGFIHFSVPISSKLQQLGALGMSSQNLDVDTFEILMTLSLFAEQCAAAIALARLDQQHNIQELREARVDSHDRQTGLLNRTSFFSELESRIKKFGEDAPRVGIVFIEIDELKRYNNSLGFDIGDAIIQRNANILSNFVKEPNFVGYFSGGSYMIALDGISGYNESLEIAKDLRNELSPAILVGIHRVNVKFSIGIALPETFEVVANELIRNAHIASTEAKASGGNKIVRFEPNMLTNVDRALDLESELRKAIINDEFNIQLQPIVELSTNMPVGVEALLYWQHPETGYMPASSFLPFAKKSGQLMDIDRRIFQKSCAAVRTLQDSGLNVPVHVNVFPVFLNSTEIVESIKSILEITGVKPESLVIEISDSEALIENSNAIDNIRQLKDFGFSIAIDNFGTGSSALSVINRLPIDQIKISKAIVNEIGARQGDTSLITSILTLANSMKIKVVAVGVENDKQIETLNELGCFYAQGYYIGKPLNLKPFLESYNKSVET